MREQSLSGPLVTIGVPVYGGQSTLPLLLDCLRQQSYRNIDVLISVDANDGISAEACAPFLREDSRFPTTVNARDRIGAGPWHNAKGVLIAANIEDLHGEANAISKETGLTEAGNPVNGRGDEPNTHDILTGSNADGTANENTCGDWTLNGEGSAMVGHHDRIGLRDDAPSKSWNASHPSRGCSQEALVGTGGAGLLYCFAAN